MNRISDGSSLASKLKLRKLTTVKTQPSIRMTTKAFSSSGYFTSNSDGGEMLANKRKRASTTVPCIDDSEKLNTPEDHGSPTVDCTKSARTLRSKRQSIQAAKTTAKRVAHKKTAESKVRPRTGEVDTPLSNQLQPFCPTMQSTDDCCTFAADDSINENSDTSSSDVEWEDVEGIEVLVTTRVSHRIAPPLVWLG